MYSLLKIGMLSLGLGVGVLLGGCQSGGAEAPEAHAMSTQAVQCDKCQTTMVNSPSSITGGQAGSVAVYSPHPETVCADCKSATANFFATGKLEHHCTACGGNMAACDAH